MSINKYLSMAHSQKGIGFELKIAFLLLFVALVNNELFVHLTSQSSSPIVAFANLQMSFTVYVLYVFVSTAAIMLRRTNLLKVIFSLLLSFLTFHIVINLYLLIVDPRIADDGKAILADAFLIWSVSLIVFSLWYWIIDRGGPISRLKNDEKTRYDLLFPQYQSDIPGWKEWKPKFLDYLFFSFFTSTGFSPADTLPLSKRAKLLMMIEAFISLIIIGMIASRAISLIQ